ncbi:MAG: Trm112 family protein [Acidobacteria bacterium]|nr:MAG: Trm112 family protein [Acidobacteriota bacterium]REK10164.1 MAG: Trm112 family protein [Acidobacteriota bacterium]
MAVDRELLDLLVCPKSHGELELVELPRELCARLVERYREHFQGETPEVERGLLCRESQLLYPIVSDIPVMLIEEALPASVLEPGGE